MHVIQCYDDKGKNLGKFAGSDGVNVDVNRSILCSMRFSERPLAEEWLEWLKAWGGDEFDFKITKVRKA
jgi:hypothetical protein